MNNDLSFSVATPSKSSDISFESSELPASSKAGKYSEMELNEHLTKMIKREKDSLKTVENKISKVKAETMKEYNALQKNLDGIIRISSKVEGQNEKYKSKCKLYEDIIKGMFLFLNIIRSQRCASKIKNSGFSFSN